MSFEAKRELLTHVAARYREAIPSQKSVILNEFVATTGYARKYAIQSLTHPVPPPPPIQRPRERHDGPEIQEALAVAWRATNFICAKRLVPFLPELVPQLERHGHPQMPPEARRQLLTMSPATADRILKPLRKANPLRGLSTTKAGKLLKHQVPIRTFTDWNETKPGFFEMDLVAHCGNTVEGTSLCTCVLTDVVTGWTECQALLYRSHETVIQALDRARQLLPFPVLGVDTDNGSEFINLELIAYCDDARLTFTRGRPYKKNAQCFVEQKNGVILRQYIGYDRFEGERVYRQLTEVYRALRLYVNFFQPSMKLLSKGREGSTVYRKYDQAQTPLRRLLATDVLSPEARARLEAIAQSLDPLQLLQQIATLQDALWPLAILPAPTVLPPDKQGIAQVRFKSEVGLPLSATNPVPNPAPVTIQAPPPGDRRGSANSVPAGDEQKPRRYHRTKTPRGLCL